MSKTCISRKDPKWVIRIRKSKQYRQYNVQQKKNKQ